MLTVHHRLRAKLDARHAAQCERRSGDGPGEPRVSDRAGHRQLGGQGPAQGRLVRRNRHRVGADAEVEATHGHGAFEHRGGQPRVDDVRVDRTGQVETGAQDVVDCQTPDTAGARQPDHAPLVATRRPELGLDPDLTKVERGPARGDLTIECHAVDERRWERDRKGDLARVDVAPGELDGARRLVLADREPATAGQLTGRDTRGQAVDDRDGVRPSSVGPELVDRQLAKRDVASVQTDLDARLRHRARHPARHAEPADDPRSSVEPGGQ